MEKQIVPSAMIREFSRAAGIVSILVLPAIALSQTQGRSTVQNRALALSKVLTPQPTQSGSRRSQEGR
jgi:hypothetical protein